MSFDPQSLERLRNLSKKLPNSQPSSTSKKTSTNESNSFLHPIETEEDPKQLFRELMNASPDGEVPTHLIDRLKEVESLQLDKELHSTKNSGLNRSTPKTFNNSNKEKINSSLPKDDLYISFKRLLLEEEED